MTPRRLLDRTPGADIPGRVALVDGQNGTKKENQRSMKGVTGRRTGNDGTKDKG